MNDVGRGEQILELLELTHRDRTPGALAKVAERVCALLNAAGIVFWEAPSDGIAESEELAIIDIASHFVDPAIARRSRATTANSVSYRTAAGATSAPLDAASVDGCIDSSLLAYPIALPHDGYPLGVMTAYYDEAPTGSQHRWAAKVARLLPHIITSLSHQIALDAALNVQERLLAATAEVDSPARLLTALASAIADAVPTRGLRIDLVFADRLHSVELYRDEDMKSYLCPHLANASGLGSEHGTPTCIPNLLNLSAALVDEAHPSSVL